jgi:hypothetical protein
MGTISNVSLSIVPDVANANVIVNYTLIGHPFDVTSGQPYTETVSLVGVVTGINPPEDNVDDPIPNGAISFSVITFPNATPISRTRTRTIAKSDLDEDVGLDEIRAVVTLTPILATAVSARSNSVTGNF